MRILHVINSLELGGAETLLVALAAAQARLGHDVSIAFVTGDAKVDVAPLSGVRLHALQAPLYSVSAARRVIALGRRHDVIHAHLAPTQYYVSLCTGVKRVVTEHNEDNRRWKYRVFRWLDRVLYNRVFRTVIAISGGVEATLRQMGVQGRAITLVYNGVNAARLQTQAHGPAPALPDRPLLVMVSRFSLQKDHRSAIDLAALLPEFAVVFIGAGDTQDAMKQYAAARRADNVIFLGAMDNPFPVTVRAFLGLQLSHYEGFGLAALEMMALGVPVLMSECPGMSVLNQEPPAMPYFRDAEQAAAYVRQLYADPQQRAALSARASRIAARFTVDATAQATLDVYAGA